MEPIRRKVDSHLHQKFLEGRFEARQTGGDGTTNISTHLHIEIAILNLKESVTFAHWWASTAFVIDAAEAVIPIAIRTPMRTFSVRGRRRWRRKVRGKRERKISVEMLTPLCAFDPFSKTELPTHFLLVMLRFYVASNGKHFRRSNRR
jgi:hypothetical protein